RVFGISEATDGRTTGWQLRILATRGTNNRGRMAAAGVAQHPLSQIRDAVPNSEIQVVARLREVNAIQDAKHRTGIVPIRVCQTTRAERVNDRNSKQGGLHTVTRDVEKVKREPLRIHPMIPQSVAAELRRNDHKPVR